MTDKFTMTTRPRDFRIYSKYPLPRMQDGIVYPVWHGNWIEEYREFRQELKEMWYE